jgi:hypothetical protein
MPLPWYDVAIEEPYILILIPGMDNYPETLLGGEVTSKGKHPRDDKRPALLALVIMGHPNAPK